MNVINVAINFEKGICRKEGISVVSGDYNSTKIVFNFDSSAENGRKVFEMKNPKGELVYVDEIVDNEIILVGKREENGEEKYFSLFNETGDYTFEVSLYEKNSKLTSVCGYITARKEQVVVEGEEVEYQITLFDNLMQELTENIGYVENLDIDAEKVETTTTITITRKDGTSYDVEVLDGEKGDKGDKGDPGAIKMQIVNVLPTTGQEDTIYLVPIEEPETGNNYEEYIYVNGAWEKLGGVQVQVDLTDYVKNTDYATSQKGGVFKLASGLLVNSNGYPYATEYAYASYVNLANSYFIGKGTLENVITGKNLETANNKVTSISASSTDTQYPTAKCMYDLIGNIEGLLEVLDIGSGARELE